MREWGASLSEKETTEAADLGIGADSHELIVMTKLE